jgi:hypothetical protein
VVPQQSDGKHGTWLRWQVREHRRLALVANLVSNGGRVGRLCCTGTRSYRFQTVMLPGHVMLVEMQWSCVNSVQTGSLAVRDWGLGNEPVGAFTARPCHGCHVVVRGAVCVCRCFFFCHISLR